MIKVRKRYAKIRSNQFVFITNRDVPATNNGAKRALRPSVVFRKVTNGFRSTWGAKLYAEIRSALDTGRCHDRSSFQAIHDTIEGRTLVPAT